MVLGWRAWPEAATFYWVKTLMLGAGLALGRAQLPTPLVPNPHDHAQLEAVPACISSPCPILRLPPTLFVSPLRL